MTTTVEGGKIWTPDASPPPQKFDKVIRALRIAKIIIQSAIALAVFVFIYKFISFTVDASEQMTVDDWSHLTTPESSWSVTIIGIMWFAIPALVGVFTLMTPIGLKRGIFMFIALLVIVEGFMFHGYQQGVVNVDNKATVSEWLDEKYGYELIEFANSEGLSRSTERIEALVLDRETGEEKLVKYYDNNGIVYFAVDDKDFHEQIKQDIHN